MLLLRDAQKSDLPGLKRLASELNTVNLPSNVDALAGLVEKSMRSFSGRIRNPFEREYLFVLEDRRNGKVIGTSLIIAQHGTYEAPHTFYQVSEREHYSATLDRHFRHKVLSIGYNYEGPTEVGGLVVDRPYRGTPEKPGKQLSYVRFLYMAMHPSLFREKVLAELLPPLLPDGRSLLWECIGKKFTGLTYQDADRLSRQNKEFIRQLFPASDIYASLFPARAQQVIGEVGPESKAVQRMLERIAFRYVDRIDPFDGGPHYEAKLSEISLFRAHRNLRVAQEDLQDSGEEMLAGCDRTLSRNRFRAVKAQVRLSRDRAVLSREVKRVLGLSAGARVSLIPLP
jgi:arginine N-succinyltransferase